MSHCLTYHASHSHLRKGWEKKKKEYGSKEGQKGKKGKGKIFFFFFWTSDIYWSLLVSFQRFQNAGAFRSVN